MKAITILKLLHMEHVANGKAYVNEEKRKNLKVTVGNIEPYALYFADSKLIEGFDVPHAILVFKNGTRQYLYKIEQ